VSELRTEIQNKLVCDYVHNTHSATDGRILVDIISSFLVVFLGFTNAPLLTIVF